MIFLVSDKDERERFFEESLLLTDVRPDIVLEISFLTMSNVDINFQAQDLQWRSYTTGEVLPITRRVKLIEKKEFATVALDLEHETFVVHIAVLSVHSGNEVDSSRTAQIAYLKADETPTKVLSKYADFTDVFVIVYLNNILIYIENEGEEHVQAVRWVLDQLRKHSMYANLKKCRFHQDEVRFLG